MQHLTQFDYIFAIGIIFAFLDAFNNGANDVANSFSSSISARSLKYWQAMLLAALCEFLGAALVGSRTSDTIKNKIVKVDAFEENPAVLMLTMACAIVGSSIWTSIATYLCMPVSSTHAVVGGVIGAGIATVGSDNITWGWKGFAQIVASWFIAPVLGGVISSFIFLITKFTVLEAKQPIKRAFMLVPVIVFTTFAILTMLIVWKGAPNLHLNKLSDGATAGAILGTAGVATLLYGIFVHPFLYRRLVHEDWTLKDYQAFYGFIYYFKSTDDIPPLPEGHSLTVDYYSGKRHAENASIDSDDIEQGDVKKDATEIELDASESANQELLLHNKAEPVPKPNIDTIKWNTMYFAGEYGVWGQMARRPAKWPLLLWLMVSHGFRHDVIVAQMDGSSSLLSGNLADLHSRCKIYDNRVEHIFSLLQCITACTMSFAHGANDIGNAAGPLAAIYNVWTTNKATSKAPVPEWVLCFTAASLVIGCWMFGYRIMAILGNKLTLQSPSRGFAIELGAAVTVVMATRLNIPVSTTQIAVGCTVFVGLCNLDLKATNWRIVIWSYLGWVITLPFAGIVAGIIAGIIINAPRWGVTYSLS